MATPLPYQWRERAKPLEDRAAEAGSFWCLCAVCAHLATFSYLTCKKVKSDQVSDCKMGDLFIKNIRITNTMTPSYQ